jgi:hypothetical protein
MARKPKVTPKKTAPANRQGSIASKARPHKGGGSNFSSTQMKTGGSGSQLRCQQPGAGENYR